MSFYEYKNHILKFKLRIFIPKKNYISTKDPSSLDLKESSLKNKKNL